MKSVPAGQVAARTRGALHPSEQYPRADERLDEALDESSPASDPPAVRQR
jgi:hypothetical protein